MYQAFVSRNIAHYYTVILFLYLLSSVYSLNLSFLIYCPLLSLYTYLSLDIICACSIRDKSMKTLLSLLT